MQKKKEKIQYAIEKDILSIYDIPFNTYVSFEMWEQIDFILADTHKGIKVYKLPGMYYSRPYIMNNMVWVFDNTDFKKRGISIFDPELNLVKTTENKEFARYEGGIRLISGNHILSGGADQDVDTIVVWNTKNQDIKTLKLEHGHYVGSLAAEHGKIYAGSCGGKVNSWDHKTMTYKGTYSTSEQENTNWEIFNSQPCINALKADREQLTGSGEKYFFIWDIETRALLKTYDKAFTGSMVYFYKNQMAEYKADKIVIRNISDGQVLNGVKTLTPVNDLIITHEDILPDYKGEMLIVSLRHNKGLVFYDLNSMEIIKSTELKGESLCVYNNQIYATDDQFIYKYNLFHKVSQKYRNFLKSINLEQVKLSDDTYYQLLKRSHEYPEVIKKNLLGKSYLEQNQLSFYHSIKYGRLPRLQEHDKYKEDNINLSKDIYGYKLIYEIKNSSDKDIFLSIICEYHGEYGSSSAKVDPEKSFYKQDLIIPADNGKIVETINIGEKEPVNLYIYPTIIEKLTRGYYDDLIHASSKENKDISIIDKYLDDPKLKKWHPELQKRKQEINAENDKSWLLKMIQ